MILLVEEYLQLFWGKQSEKLVVAGFASGGPHAKSAETKFKAVTKMIATRKARHTMGARQRREIVANGAGAMTNGAAAN